MSASPQRAVHTPQQLCATFHPITPVKRDRDWSPAELAATEAAAPQWIAAFLSMPFYGGSAGRRKPGRFAQAGSR